MKKIAYFFVLFTGLVLATSCSSSSNDDDIATLELEGRWQLETMDFTDTENIKWDFEKHPFNRPLGYAPFMFSGAQISGFNFGHGDVLIDDEVVGDRFDYIMRGFEPPKFEETFSYWYWNYTNGGKSFEVKQTQGGGLPPDMDYELYNIRNLSISGEGEGRTLEFTADLSTTKPGGEREDKIKTPVDFTLTKGAPTKYVEVLVGGEPFQVPGSDE